MNGAIIVMVWWMSAWPCNNMMAGVFHNPIGRGQDPSIKYYNGQYIYADTDFSHGIYVYVSSRLATILDASRHSVYQDAAMSRSEAPDIDLLTDPADQKKHWFIYVSDSMPGNHVFVYESASDDPLSQYKSLGKLKNVSGYDANILALPDGSLYLAYSGINLIPLKNPYTTIGHPVTITPTNMYAWESGLQEAPCCFVHNGMVSIVYSTQYWGSPKYEEGMLTASLNSDLLSSKSWVKHASPVLQQSSKTGVYGPGSICQFSSPDGKQTWIAFGAFTSSAGSSTRHIWVQPAVGWNADNTPNLGIPASPETLLNDP
jgi:GH43 family beta-xylosidase